MTRKKAKTKKSDPDRPGIFTETKRGKLTRIKVNCDDNSGSIFSPRTDRLVVRGGGDFAVFSIRIGSNASLGILVPRKRLFTLARLLKAMAKQLPKEGE